MSAQKRELYSSPHGDRWFLRRDPATGSVFIRHEANAPSGGHATEMDIATFLSGGPRNPEHQALLQLIGTLVESDHQGVDETRRDGSVRKSPWAPMCRTRGAVADSCGLGA